MKSSCSSAIDTVNYTIVKIQTMQGLSHEFKFPRKAVMSINTDLTSVFFKKFFKKGYEHGFYRLGHEDAYFEPYLDEDLDADRLKVKSQQAFLKPLLRKIKLDLETEDRVDLFILYGDYNIFKKPMMTCTGDKCCCNDCDFEPWKVTEELRCMVPAEFDTMAMDYLHARHTLITSPASGWKRCRYIESRFGINSRGDIYKKNLEQRREYQCDEACMWVMKYYDSYPEAINHPYCRLYMFVKDYMRKNDQWRFPTFVLDHISQELGDFKDFDCLVNAFFNMKDVYMRYGDGVSYTRRMSCADLFHGKFPSIKTEWLRTLATDFLRCECRRCSMCSDDRSESDDDDY